MYSVHNNGIAVILLIERNLLSRYCSIEIHSFHWLYLLHSFLLFVLWHLLLFSNSECDCTSAPACRFSFTDEFGWIRVSRCSVASCIVPIWISSQPQAVLLVCVAHPRLVLFTIVEPPPCIRHRGTVHEVIVALCRWGQGYTKYIKVRFSYLACDVICTKVSTAPARIHNGVNCCPLGVAEDSSKTKVTYVKLTFKVFPMGSNVSFSHHIKLLRLLFQVVFINMYIYPFGAFAIFIISACCDTKKY